MSRPVPDDFAQQVALLKVKVALTKHYRVGSNRLYRWLAEAGLSLKGGDKPRPNRRPVPADFAKQVKRLKYKKLIAQHYNVGFKALYRWLSESGISLTDGRKSPFLKAPPADFMQIAPTMSREKLCAHYDCGDKVLRRWIAETGVAFTSGARPRLHLPPGFALAAPSMTHGELMAHYGVSKGIITRWCEETGTKPFRHRAEPKQKRVISMAPSRGQGVQFTITKTYGEHDLAADVLRRHFAVHRCDERGRYEERGKFWRVGTVVCTPDELLERADRARERAA